MGTVNIILVSGLPRSGKSTSLAKVEEYLNDHDIEYTVITSNSRRTRKNDAIELIAGKLYQAIMERKYDTILVEGPFVNVFDRKVLFDKLDDAWEIKHELAIHVFAIQHNRSNRFVFEHNKLSNEKALNDIVEDDDNDKVFSDRVIISALKRYQQPVREEGFTIIHNVNGERYLNMNKFSEVLNRIDGRFPIVFESEEENEGMKDENVEEA